LTRIFLTQSRSQLPTAPTPLPPAQPTNPRQPFRGSLTWRAFWTTRSIAQPDHSLDLESSLPFVASLAACSKQSTQLRHALLGLQSHLCKR
jgi:hypothetical protein